MTKSILRKQMLARRAVLTSDEIAARSARITAQVLSMEAWAGTDSVLAYYAVRGEADPTALVQAAWDAGKKVYLPRVIGKEMIFLPYTPLTRLEKSRYGIPEPALQQADIDGAVFSGSETAGAGVPNSDTTGAAVPDADFGSVPGAADTSESDGSFRKMEKWSAAAGGRTLVLVPGAAFSPDGYRIGYGGGYYDRYFADRSRTNERGVMLIGLAYDFQITADIAPEPYDVRLDAVAAPERVLYFL